jgi:hypothetical protein
MALPEDVAVITLTGTYLDMQGNGRSGTVTFTPTTPVLVDAESETILGGIPVPVALNSSGEFSVVLPCTSGLTPSGWVWGVTENVSGATARSYAIALPSSLGETVDISTLTPVTPGPVVSSYLLASTLGEANGVAQLNGDALVPVTEGGTGASTAAAAVAAIGALAEPTGGSYPGGTTEFLRADQTWAVPAGGGGGTALLAQTAVQPSAYTATANQLVPVDTTTGPVTVTLPGTPAAGTICGVKLVTLGTGNAVTVAAAGSDVFNKAGGSTSVTLSLLGQGVLLQYDSGVWLVLSDDLPLTQIESLFVAQSSLPLPGSDVAAATSSSAGAVTLGGGSGTAAVQLNYRGAVQYNTTYNPGDVILYNGGRIYITSTVTTATVGTNGVGQPFISGSHYTAVSAQAFGVYYAFDYGVTGSGTTDDWNALQTLICLVRSLSTISFSGYRIILPAGTCAISKPIILPSQCWLEGDGLYSSTLKVMAAWTVVGGVPTLTGNGNCDAVQPEIFNSASQAAILANLSPAQSSQYSQGDLRNAFRWRISNLTIHGNASQQSPGSYYYCLNIATSPTTTSAASDPDFDPAGIVENVQFRAASGDGFIHNGRSALRLVNTLAWFCNGNGYSPSFDTQIDHTQAGFNGMGGYYFNHGADQGAGNKSYNNGTNANWVSAVTASGTVSGTAVTGWAGTLTPVVGYGVTGGGFSAGATITGGISGSSGNWNFTVSGSGTAGSQSLAVGPVYTYGTRVMYNAANPGVPGAGNLAYDCLAYPSITDDTVAPASDPTNWVQVNQGIGTAAGTVSGTAVTGWAGTLAPVAGMTVTGGGFPAGATITGGITGSSGNYGFTVSGSGTSGSQTLTVASLPTSPQAWGCGVYVDGNAGEITFNCDCQSNSAWSWYCHNLNSTTSTGVLLTGCSNNPNFYNPTDTQETTNPNYYSDVCLDNSRGVTASIVCGQPTAVSGVSYRLRIVNGSTHNDVTLTGDAHVTSLLTPDSTAILSGSVSSGNYVRYNGTDYTTTLASQNDVSITSPGNGQVLTFNSGTGKWGAASQATGDYVGTFGDGSNGTATLDGSTAYTAWATLSGGNYTMKTDAFLTSLTINSGVTLFTAGYRLFCNGTVTNNGVISNVGGAGAASGTAGAVPGNASVCSSAGGAGGTGAGGAGNNTPGTTLGVGASGAGGAGSSGAAGGSAGPLNSVTFPYRTPAAILSGSAGWNGSVKQPAGGCGGGGGGGDGTNHGGGGGAGGGIVAIMAQAVVNTGTITAAGGAGGSPATVVTNGGCGGGGGGGGGLILVYTLSAWTAGTTVVTGGTGGTAITNGSGTASNGSNGASGNVLNVVLQ